MSSFNVTFVARTPPPGLDSKEGRPRFASVGRIDGTSNRSGSPGIDCALTIPVSRLELKTMNPNSNVLTLRLTQRLEMGVVIVNSLKNSVAFDCYLAKATGVVSES